MTSDGLSDFVRVSHLEWDWDCDCEINYNCLEATWTWQSDKEYDV